VATTIRRFPINKSIKSMLVMKTTKPMNSSQQAEIDRFLSSGEYDNHYEIWSGNTFFVQAKNGDNALRSALMTSVLDHANQVAILPSWQHGGRNINLREKFAPMVRGLLPQKEHSVILDILEKSVVFLTPENIVNLLENMTWLKSAWNLANIYLLSLDAQLLADNAPRFVGMSEETTCYVSMEYFRNDNKFDDYVIHEAAHIFHNCKRNMIGLTETRTREWLLDINYFKRETFAYACEAYSRIIELGQNRATRSNLIAQLSEEIMPSDDRVDTAEYVDILREAVAARNGWKRILARCSNQ
jgi:hypothetical protein